MIGQTISHFEVLERLGEGGMGVVYKARDQHLDRFVALKVLQPEAVGNPDRRRRFVQEAKAASALNHPNIVHIYDIGEADGALFIAMEYVAGATIDQLIRGGELSLPQALRASVQIADALATAHAAGIVHRDLKPSNLMITPAGLVKVLDFGLAKLIEVDGDASASEETRSMQVNQPRTEEGVVIGTAAYMSPEQAEGKKIDARSDIFSFGAVVYEMITGRRAFSGSSRIATLSAVMRDEPSSASQIAPGIPAELERIVQRCLRKDPARRAQNMADVKVQLEEVREESSMPLSAPTELAASAQVAFTPESSAGPASGSVAGSAAKSAATVTSLAAMNPAGQVRSTLPWAFAAVLVVVAVVFSFWWRSRSAQTIESLAVLPFTNVGSAANTEYLSDGVTESLTNALAQLPNLKVASRNAASRFKEVDAKRAASELGVRAVLIGKIRQQGDALAVSVELVDGKDSSHIWGEHYDRKLSDLVTVQQEITNDIAGKLQLKLSGQDRLQIAKQYSTKTDAYQLYLQGRYEAEKFTPEGVNAAIDDFNRAIKADPSFALAYDGLSEVYAIAEDLFLSPEDAMPKAKQAAQKAIVLDDTLAEAHVEMANVLFFYDFDWKAAEREYQRAFTLKADYAKAHEYRSWLLLTLGRREEGIAESATALRLDPLSIETHNTVGMNLWLAHSYDDAITHLQKTISMEPNNWFATYFLGRAHQDKGDFPKAIAAYQQALKLEPKASWAASELAVAYARVGRKNDAEQSLQELNAWSQRSFVPQYLFAPIYAALGDRPRALTYLEKAYQDRSFFMLFLPLDSDLDSLRSEPRFKELLRKLDLQQ